MGERHNFEKSPESSEAKSVQAIAELSTALRLCIMQGCDRDIRKATEWSLRSAGPDLEDERNIGDILKDLYEADPGNFSPNVTKALNATGAGRGLRQLAAQWVFVRQEWERQAKGNNGSVN